MKRGQQQLVVISNRGPYREVTTRGRRQLVRSSGGLVSALDPVLRERGGTWISAASSDADGAISLQEHARRSRQKGDSELPHEYRLATAQLTKSVRAGFYDGFSNAVLWPMLHSFPPTIRLGQAPWESYVTANQAFAETTLRESNSDDLIWVQDYHLMLVPAMLRQQLSKTRIGWFCHVPWPSPEIFGILPWRKEILEGLLGADVLAFHTEEFAENFLRCVERYAGLKVDLGRKVVRSKGRQIRATGSPIGISVNEVQTMASQPAVQEKMDKIRQMVGGRRIILGVDRLDYTKGIPERILAFEQFLRRDRSARARYVYVQVMVPSRTDVAAYARLKSEVDRLIGDVNGRYSTTGRVAIHYLFQSLEQISLFAHYRVADVALVTPLRDGMNLVAQEYVTCRLDGDGVLVLSEFAGAASYLKHAVMVNPYNIGELALRLEQALEMPQREQKRRMRELRTEVHKLDVHRWAASCIKDIEGK